MRKHQTWVVALLAALLILATTATLDAQKKKKKAAPSRSVKGLVTDQSENPLTAAVVQLKNTRSLQVKSFITPADGSYYFHGLDFSTDYEMVARYKEDSSRKRTVSSLDGRDEVIYNFKIKLEK